MSSTSSSDVDSEEAQRLQSVAIDSSAVALRATSSQHHHRRPRDHHSDDDASSGSLKHYQARARNLLNEYMDKTFETGPIGSTANGDLSIDCNDALSNGFRLFKQAPPGLSEKRPRREEVAKVRIRKRHQHDEAIGEKSELFQSHLLSATIDGATVKLKAEMAVSKAFEAWISKQEKQKQAQQIENERIALLKKERGEQWLPSVARDLGINLASNGTHLSSLQQRKLITVTTKGQEAKKTELEGVEGHSKKKKKKKKGKEKENDTNQIRDWLFGVD